LVVKEEKMSLKSNFTRPTYLGYMAILRIAVGYHFVSVAWPKVTGPFLQGKILSAELVKSVGKDPLAFHRAFITGVVLPHAPFVAHLVAFGELAIGLSLLAGCLVRLSASFAAFHNLNILLAIAVANGGPQLGLNRIFIVLELMFVLSSAGVALGLDGLLKKRFPNSKLF
ncbi:MAG: DoxX family membrane protein, partial [Acidobacteriota bacterium]|nr:DoxX family membrane protein [Acidobacteriota bacterium]